MSHIHNTPTSSNFQLIFDSAFKAYKKRTEKDLLKHPLADRLQACDSPSSILAVLQEQVQKLNQSRGSNERLTKWLNPTVVVLTALSGTFGEGVGLVSIGTLNLPKIYTLIFISQVFSPAKAIFIGFGILLSVCNLS